MDQIIVTHLAGGTTKLRSIENTSSITKAVQSVELLNKDIVDITVESAKKLVFLIGDKINILGRDYTLNIPARETKVSEFSFQYTLQFEGVQYDLARATYDVNLDTTGSDLKGDSLTGDMKMFLDVLMLNIGRIFPGKWTLGTYPLTSETMTLTFAENDNCLSVLQTLCGKYGTEFDIVIDANGNRVLNIGQVGKDFTFTFEYGKNKGLYTLTREKVSSSNIVNRLKVYGSTRNITTKYRSTRLCLPGKNKSESYLEDAASIAAFGVWENAKIYEDIYPRRTGTITSLGSSVYSFVDTAMDFDLNEKEADGVTTKYLLPGTAAKIKFNTGGLAGYEFDIQSYDHETKTFTILRQTDERGMSFPSESSAAFQFAQGDQYVILDIALPQSYETAAETDLETAGTAYLGDNCQPKVQYSLDVDHKFLEDIVGADVDSNIFWVGDNIPIKDTDIEVDKTIRIKGFERDLLKDYGYTLSISDLSVTRTVYSRVISEHGDQKKIIKFNRLNDYARARRNYLDAQEVLNMIFDPEGDFYSDKIKPLSIDTTMLSVGSKSMQFGLSNTIFQPNYAGNKNRVVYTGGSLVHYAILDTNKNPRIWNITDGDVMLSADADAYFVYAKCQKAASGGTMLFTTSKIIADSDPNYYHFLIGVINSVDSGTSTRSMSMMYGFSTVNGRFIKTGRITSSGETVSYIDLDEGSMALGEALTWNIGGDKKLRIKGAIMQTAAGEDIVTVNHKGAYASGTTYQKYDSVTYGGAVWLYINNTPSAGNTPAEGAYWTIYVAKGSGGSVALTVTKQAFNYNEAGALTDTGTWFVVATVFNIPGTLYYEWLVNDSTVQNATNYAYGLVPPANYANMPVKYKVNVRVGSTTGDIVATDMITIYGLKEGTGGVTAIVSNDAHVLAAGNDGAISSYAGSGTDIIVFIGTTPIPYGTGAGTFDVTAAGSGITPGAASTVSTYTRRFADHSAMTLDNAVITYTIKVRNASGTEITITKIQSFSKSKAGAAGSPGAAGAPGPSLVYRGQWDSSVSDYTGTTSRIDVVRIGTEGSFAWYKAKTTAGTIPANTNPTNTTYWESFGGVFQSIATGILLAESANIAEFIFKGGKLISQKGTLFGAESTNFSHASFIPYISIDGVTGDVTFKKATIEGALNAGSVGGFTIANERIGALSDANGLSILASLIKFYNSSVNVWAGIGENVLPPSVGLRALGRFDNKELQGYYQQQFLRYDYYYSEQSYYNAGSPTPANWVYDEYMQFQHIEVTIYQNVFVPYTGSLNYGIIAQVEGAEQNIAFQAIKGKIISSYGGVISWDTGYYGPASSYIIQWNIEKFSQFIFSSISSSLMNVYLPSSTDINDHTSGSVYFLLNITVGYETNNSIRLQSVTNGQLRDNDGNTLSYIDMRKGDSILLRYSEGNYYIVSLRQ